MYNTVKTTYYGLESISYLAIRIWDQIPNNIRNCRSLKDFKKAIKGWIPKQCPYRLWSHRIPLIVSFFFFFSLMDSTYWTNNAFSKLSMKILELSVRCARACQWRYQNYVLVTAFVGFGRDSYLIFVFWFSFSLRMYFVHRE